MADGDTLALFAAAALALIVIPGPAVLYIVAQSVEHGRRVGIASAAGVSSGALLHVGAAAAGVSALVVSSAVAFSVVKYAGAAYLVALGVRRLARRDLPDASPPAEARLGRAFRRGVVVNVLNPKVALFFLAFLPQFVDPGAAPVAVQMLLLGVLFATIGLLSDSLYALAAGSLARRLRGRHEAGRYASATVYLGLGTATALAQRH